MGFMGCGADKPSGLRLFETRSVALVASIALVLALTLAPTSGDRDVELVPFQELVDAVGDRDDGRLLDVLVESAANVLLFVPLGAALAYSGLRTAQAVCAGVALAACVEIVQLLLIPGRTTALDDMLLNALGTLLGYALLSRWRGTP
jgi:glycopeptide antibiotics resistance protein